MDGNDRPQRILRFNQSKSHLDELDARASDKPLFAAGRASRAPSPVKQVWAVGGGKGGVGKSLICSSLAISLARLGNNVVAIDLDLGGANLHTTLGIDLPRQTLSDFLNDRVASLQACVIPSGIPHLSIISGAQDAVGIPHLKEEQQRRLIASIRELNADYVVIDLGAGTSGTTLDFFLTADLGFIVGLPEPTSIENAYRFIKAAYYRRLLGYPGLELFQELVQSALDPRSTGGIRSPSDLYKECEKRHPAEAGRLRHAIETFAPKLIMNQARAQSDVDIGLSMQTVCKKYFGIDLDYLGYLDYDSAVWQAIRKKRPVLLEFPNSRLVSSIDRIVTFTLKRYGHVRSEFA